MLEQKFNLLSLYELNKKFNEIQVWATMQRSDEHMLYPMIDHLCRVAGMYNDVVIQLLKDGCIETGDPLGYIEGKFSTSYRIYQRMTKEDLEK